MRFAAVLLAGFVGLTASALSVQAAPLTATGVQTNQSANIVDVAVRCGPHARYVRGHWAPHHHYIRGRCVRR